MITFRKPGDIRGLAAALEHAAECQDFAMNAPIIYLTIDETSYMLRLQSAQGPRASEKPTLQARRILGLLRQKLFVGCAARVPRSESFLKPI